jgi:galactokinase
MEPIPFDLAHAGLGMLVVDTSVRHAHAEGGYAERRASCERAAAVLGVPALRDTSLRDLTAARDRMDELTYRRARHIVTENQRVQETVALLRSAGPGTIGDLLLDSHRSMRDDFEISVPELDTAVEAAMAAGAIGARMTGGGFGGSAIVLLDARLAAEASTAIREAFAQRRFAEPAIFPARPSQGARRDVALDR